MTEVTSITMAELVKVASVQLTSQFRKKKLVNWISLEMFQFSNGFLLYRTIGFSLLHFRMYFSQSTIKWPSTIKTYWAPFAQRPKTIILKVFISKCICVQKMEWLLMIKPKSKVSWTTKAELGTAIQFHSLASLLLEKKTLIIR